MRKGRDVVQTYKEGNSWCPFACACGRQRPAALLRTNRAPVELIVETLHGEDGIGDWSEE